MIFNFFKQIFRRTHFWESVTERKLPVQLWNFHQGSYTPQEHHPSDRIFGQMPECDFFFFLLYFRNSGYYTWSNPHQLPRETLWRELVRTWVWFLPPTSVGIVTENPLTGRKAKKLSKSRKCSELKSKSPFLGDVRLIKVVSEFSFGHWKCHFFVPEHGHFC